VVLAVLAVAGWREHWPAAVFGRPAAPALAWSAAQAPLPANAARTGTSDAGLNDVVCSSPRSCLAVGYYDSNGSGSGQSGLIETLSGGTWTPSVPAIDVAPAGQGSFIVLIAVACPAAGSCVAVGSTSNDRGATRPLIQTLSGGTWTTAAAPLPADADQATSASLDTVSCPAPGTCAAAGWYAAAGGDRQALIETLSGGAWSAAKAPLPADARPVSSTASLATALWLVTCPTIGSCVAVGDYQDRNGRYQGLIERLSGGTWTPIRAPLPGDAAANPAAYLFGLACPATGTCVAVGHYNSGNGQSENLIESLSGGTWTPSAGPLPAGAPARQKWSASTLPGFDAIACPAAGDCVAAGTDSGRNAAVAGMIDTLSGGTWSAAQAPLPAGAGVSGKSGAFFGGASCPAPGDCIAVGGYETQSGGYNGVIETGAAKSG
jgi:hypothetical protein